jgi:hypothetical protein
MIRAYLNYLKPLVTKKHVIRKDKMINSNSYRFCSKCYLNFYKIVADGMQSNIHLALLLNNLLLVI